MSLRSRLVVGTALVGFVLAMAAVLITRTTEAYLVGQIDDQLDDAARAVQRLAFVDRPDPGGFGAAPPDGERESFFTSLFVATVADDGTVVVGLVPNTRAGEAPEPELPVDDIVALDAGETKLFSAGATGSDSRYRVMVTAAPDGESATVVALPRDDVDAAVERLVQVETVATALVVAVLALVTYWVIRHGVRPIKRMTATATAIAEGDLSHRVDTTDRRTEAGELGAALNRMLGRIEGAFEQQVATEQRLRRFVADASHELRTPVATMRGYAELYRTGGLDEPGELREAMRRTEQEAIRMSALIDDLLLLAAADQGRPLEHVPVDLAVVAADAVRDARAVDPHRPITATIDDAVTVTGDDGRLRQVVGNLVRNALVHTPAPSPVDVRVARMNGHAVLEVRDEGPGMDPDVAAKAFERFYRADPARTRRRGGGSGLGLAIVESTVAALGGTVALDTAPGRGTTVRIELPLDPD